MKCFKIIQNLLIRKPTDLKNHTFLLREFLVLLMLMSVYYVRYLYFNTRLVVIIWLFDPEYGNTIILGHAV